MRVVFVGTNPLSLMTAERLLQRGHEVIVVERDRERIASLTEELDCGFLHGDGTRPQILREADPEASDYLFCLTGNDQSNIIASLVGRSLGFSKVVTRIDDAGFDHICMELGLEDTIVPSQAIGRHLADMVEGHGPVELSALIKDEARLFAFVVHEEDAGPLAELELPDRTRVICFYRQDRFMLPVEDTSLKAGDEVVLIAHRKSLRALEERWGRRTAPPEEGSIQRDSTGT